jgi:hypothetical protein
MRSLKRQVNEASDFFAGKTQARQNEMTVDTTLLPAQRLVQGGA